MENGKIPEKLRLRWETFGQEVRRCWSHAAENNRTGAEKVDNYFSCWAEMKK